MSTATLEGNRVSSARVWLPAWGIPTGEVTLVEPVELAIGSRVTLQLADLTFRCTIASGGPSKSVATYRLVGGAGGWGRTIPAKGYANDGGVKLSTVVIDAALTAGEELAGDVPPTRLGPAWARAEDPAGRVLELVAPRGWYVDEAGATRFGRRPAVPLAIEARIGAPDRARGRVTFAAEAIATLLPGVIVEGIEAVDVVHSLEAGQGISTTVFGQGMSPTDRVLTALAALLDQLRPYDRYRGVFEYRVISQDGERLTVQAVLASEGLPDVRRLRVRPGVPGVKAELPGGSKVLVAFINADPGRPVVVGFEDAEGGGFSPSAWKLDASEVHVDADEVHLDGIQVGLTNAQCVGRFIRYGDPFKEVAGYAMSGTTPSSPAEGPVSIVRGGP